MCQVTGFFSNGIFSMLSLRFGLIEFIITVTGFD